MFSFSFVAKHKSLAKKLCSTNTHIIVGLIAQLRADSSQIISLSNLISIITLRISKTDTLQDMPNIFKYSVVNKYHFE